ncbi:hypothetical protein QUC31_015341 [Theobroma cacao]
MAIFRKVLTSTDVERRLSFPEHSLADLPPFEGSPAIDFPVMDDEDGSVWTFCCTFRAGVFPRPVIVKGWSQFVRSKELKSGDMVVLYKEEDSGARYKIKVKKSSNLVVPKH